MRARSAITYIGVCVEGVGGERKGDAGCFSSFSFCADGEVAAKTARGGNTRKDIGIFVGGAGGGYGVGGGQRGKR